MSPAVTILSTVAASSAVLAIAFGHSRTYGGVYVGPVSPRVAGFCLLLAVVLGGLAVALAWGGR